MQSCPAQGRQGKGKSGVELKGMGVSLRGKHIRGELKKCFVKRSALPTPTRPPTLPGVDTQPVQGHTRAGPCRGGTGLFKPLLDILLSSGLCHKGFVLLQVPIKHTRSQRAFFGGGCWQWGNPISLHFRSPQWLQGSAPGFVLSKGHQIKARLKPDCRAD